MFAMLHAHGRLWPMTSKNYVRLLVMIAGFTCLSSSAVAQEPPDGLALLRGVEQSRLSLKSGRMDVNSTLMGTRRPDTMPRQLKMEWDRDHWTVRIRQLQEFMTEEEGAKLTEARKKGEPRPEGLGYKKEVETRVAWNGNKIVQFHDFGTTAAYLVREKASGEVAFDPRIFGLAFQHTYFEELQGSLRLNAIKEFLPTQKDEINNTKVWRVMLIDKYDYTCEFWIEETKSFRVHRLRMISKDGQDGHESLLSYPEKSDSAILPDTVKVYEIRKGKRPPYYSLFTMQNLNVGQVTRNDIGTINSLDLPVGTKVIDKSPRKELGYWDGTGLSRVPIEPKTIPQQIPGNPPDRR